jgi:hypothetical protein
MNSIYMTMAAVTAVSLAAPASAQGGRDRTYSHQLQVQIDAGISRGTISRRESVELREDLSRLVRLERRFSPNGISGREHAVLMQRSTSLAKDIRVASRSRDRRGDRPMSWESGERDGQWVPDARFAGMHPGDRYLGDARIGQHATAHIMNMPVQYRSEYVDTDRVYYGYDNGRVYQIDRQSRMILALLDIAR